MELSGGSLQSPSCGLGLDGKPVPVLSTALLVAQASPATPADRGLHKTYPQEDSGPAPECQRIPTQLLPSWGYFSNKRRFGTTNISCSRDLSSLLQGCFGEPPLKIWTPVPLPTTSNTQSRSDPWQIYVFQKGNGGTRRIARKGHLKKFGNSALPHAWKIRCQSNSSKSGRLAWKSTGRFFSAQFLLSLQFLTELLNQSCGICTSLLLSHLQPETCSLLKNYLPQRETELLLIRKIYISSWLLTWSSLTLNTPIPHCFVNTAQCSQPKMLAAQAHPAGSWELSCPSTGAPGNQIPAQWLCCLFPNRFILIRR